MSAPTDVNFLGLEGALADDATAAASILPVPFERTTSYRKGTVHGPRALLQASTQVELFDPHFDGYPCAMGISTLAPLVPASDDMAAALDEIEAAARGPLERRRLLVTVGGEHSLTLGPLRAAQSLFGDLGVVQFDAHADLRQTYDGTPFSHACIMRRVLDLGLPTAAVGLRSLSRAEAELIRRRRLPVIWGHQLADAASRFDALLEALPPRVYLTFDVDYFDPSLLPATGTPEPGGGSWHPTLALLERLFTAKEVVAMDLVELAPIPGQPASDFVAARLLYHCLGCYRRRIRGTAADPDLPVSED
ncbi:MAG: agmatinase [Acidobacteria bacterium]|nr:MAG: agmatinase [Acidobacteriota bacterium]